MSAAAFDEVLGVAATDKEADDDDTEADDEDDESEAAADVAIFNSFPL